MLTTTLTCPAVAPKKVRATQKDDSVKKSMAISCIFLVFAAIINPSTANANILTTLSGTELLITKNVFQYEFLSNECGVFSYRQRIIIDGKTEMVLTDRIYEVGKYTLTFHGQCDGYNLYGVGSCDCIAATFKETPPNFNTKLTSSMDSETASAEIVMPEQTRSTVTPKTTGSLWIRKE